jgi:hypothetical protein
MGDSKPISLPSSMQTAKDAALSQVIDLFMYKDALINLRGA